MNFKAIKFGNADAREEGAYEPGLLTKGYYNINSITDEVRNPLKISFLGPKGSGKSALSEHLRLTFNKHDTFVNNLLLKDFPYKSFKRIIEGQEEVQSKLPKAWNWIILIYVIDSLSRDAGLKRDVDNKWDKTISKLKNHGLSPSDDINDLVNRSSKRNFKIGLTEAFKIEYQSGQVESDLESKFYHLVKHLKDLISNIKSNSTHYLIIDGLDEVLSTGEVTRDIQYHSLAALINESKSLNLYFRNSGLNIKIVILCRTDLFERLPDPNKNKIRRDSSFLLHWQPETQESTQSPLVKLANLRASLSSSTKINLFDEFFPESFEGMEIHNYLLQYTRHTPRDFLQLLKFIQDFTREDKVEISSMLTGIGEYSVRYFLPEIKDEMVGYLNIDQIQIAIEALSMIRARSFTTIELESKIESNSSKGSLTCKELIHILFECGALGQQHKDKTNKTRTSFRFRNPHSTLQMGDRFIIHRGLWKALNIN